MVWACRWEAIERGCEERQEAEGAQTGAPGLAGLDALSNKQIFDTKAAFRCATPHTVACAGREGSTSERAALGASAGQAALAARLQKSGGGMNQQSQGYHSVAACLKRVQ